MSDGISGAFQLRRQLALAVAELAQKTDGRSLISATRDIYDSFPDELIQAEILRNLETPDSQLRGGMGQLAALLPSDEIGPALRAVAADRSQTAHRRLTAAMLLSRYIGDPVSPALLSDLRQGDEVAFQSLVEAVEEGKRNRHILLEYVLQMRQAGDHVAPKILEILDRIPESDRVELLRLIALDDRESVAEDALARLEALASSPASAEALRALHVLQFVLPPNLTGLAEDALRRQRFRGNVYRPPKPDGWRALMGIADLTGNQALWFVRTPADAESDGAILYMSVNNYTGQLDAFAQEDMQVDELPPQQTAGQIAPIQTDAGRQVPFLEVPFDFARWRVQQLLALLRETTPELPPEFRLYCDLIWEFDRPEPPVDLLRFFDTSRGEDTDESPGEHIHEAATMTAQLLNQPVMALWLNHNRSLVATLPDTLVPSTSEERAALVRAILAQMEQHLEGQHLSAAMAASLRAQAAWFEISGNRDAAELALALAESVAGLRVSQNPLLAAVVDAELLRPSQRIEDDSSRSDE